MKLKNIISVSKHAAELPKLTQVAEEYKSLSINEAGIITQTEYGKLKALAKNLAEIAPSLTTLREDVSTLSSDKKDITLLKESVKNLQAAATSFTKEVFSASESTLENTQSYATVSTKEWYSLQLLHKLSEELGASEPEIASFLIANKKLFLSAKGKVIVPEGTKVFNAGNSAALMHKVIEAILEHEKQLNSFLEEEVTRVQPSVSTEEQQNDRTKSLKDQVGLAADALTNGLSKVYAYVQNMLSSAGELKAGQDTYSTDPHVLALISTSKEIRELLPEIKELSESAPKYKVYLSKLAKELQTLAESTAKNAEDVLNIGKETVKAGVVVLNTKSVVQHQASSIKKGMLLFAKHVNTDRKKTNQPMLTFTEVKYTVPGPKIIQDAGDEVSMERKIDKRLRSKPVEDKAPEFLSAPKEISSLSGEVTHFAETAVALRDAVLRSITSYKEVAGLSKKTKNTLIDNITTALKNKHKDEINKLDKEAKIKLESAVSRAASSGNFDALKKGQVAGVGSSALLQDLYLLFTKVTKFNELSIKGAAKQFQAIEGYIVTAKKSANGLKVALQNQGLIKTADAGDAGEEPKVVEDYVGLLEDFQLDLDYLKKYAKDPKTLRSEEGISTLKEVLKFVSKAASIHKGADVSSMFYEIEDELNENAVMRLFANIIGTNVSKAASAETAQDSQEKTSELAEAVNSVSSIVNAALLQGSTIDIDELSHKLALVELPSSKEYQALVDRLDTTIKAIQESDSEIALLDIIGALKAFVKEGIVSAAVSTKAINNIPKVEDSDIEKELNSLKELAKNKGVALDPAFKDIQSALEAFKANPVNVYLDNGTSPEKAWSAFLAEQEVYRKTKTDVSKRITQLIAEKKKLPHAEKQEKEDIINAQIEEQRAIEAKAKAALKTKQDAYFFWELTPSMSSAFSDLHSVLKARAYFDNFKLLSNLNYGAISKIVAADVSPTSIVEKTIWEYADKLKKKLGEDVDVAELDVDPEDLLSAACDSYYEDLHGESPDENLKERAALKELYGLLNKKWPDSEFEDAVDRAWGRDLVNRQAIDKGRGNVVKFNERLTQAPDNTAATVFELMSGDQEADPVAYLEEQVSVRRKRLEVSEFSEGGLAEKSKNIASKINELRASKASFLETLDDTLSALDTDAELLLAAIEGRPDKLSDATEAIIDQEYRLAKTLYVSKIDKDPAFKAYVYGPHNKLRGISINDVRADKVSGPMFKVVTNLLSESLNSYEGELLPAIYELGKSMVAFNKVSVVLSSKTAIQIDLANEILDAKLAKVVSTWSADTIQALVRTVDSVVAATRVVADPDLVTKFLDYVQTVKQDENFLKYLKSASVGEAGTTLSGYLGSAKALVRTLPAYRISSILGVFKAVYKFFEENPGRDIKGFRLEDMLLGAYELDNQVAELSKEPEKDIGNVDHSDTTILLASHSHNSEMAEILESRGFVEAADFLKEVLGAKDRDLATSDFHSHILRTVAEAYDMCEDAEEEEEYSSEDIYEELSKELVHLKSIASTEEVFGYANRTVEKAAIRASRKLENRSLEALATLNTAGKIVKDALTSLQGSVARGELSVELFKGFEKEAAYVVSVLGDQSLTPQRSAVALVAVNKLLLGLQRTDKELLSSVTSKLPWLENNFLLDDHPANVVDFYQGVFEAKVVKSKSKKASVLGQSSNIPTISRIKEIKKIMRKNLALVQSHGTHGLNSIGGDVSADDTIADKYMSSHADHKYGILSATESLKETASGFFKFLSREIREVEDTEENKQLLQGLNSIKDMFQRILGYVDSVDAEHLSADEFVQRADAILDAFGGVLSKRENLKESYDVSIKRLGYRLLEIDKMIKNPDYRELIMDSGIEAWRNRVIQEVNNLISKNKDTVANLYVNKGMPGYESSDVKKKLKELVGPWSSRVDALLVAAANDTLKDVKNFKRSTQGLPTVLRKQVEEIRKELNLSSDGVIPDKEALARTVKRVKEQRDAAVARIYKMTDARATFLRKESGVSSEDSNAAELELLAIAADLVEAAKKAEAVAQELADRAAAEAAKGLTVSKEKTEEPEVAKSAASKLLNALRGL